MRLTLFSLFVLTLVACSHSSSKQDTTGVLLHKVSCSEFNTNQEQCKAKAKEKCPNGIARITHYQEDYEDQGDGFIVHTQHNYTVQCKQ